MIADPEKKTLIIVESPTKARTIKKYLPPSCTVMASKGHIKDLAVSPKTGVYGVDVDSDYELEYDKLSSEKDKLVKEMKSVLKDSEQLVLASDEDREGESIAYHLLCELKPKCPVYRMVFHEITRSAITSAFSSCREIDMNLVHAQEARRVVDRLHGYGISPIVSRKLGKSALSAGRVQSPALRLLVDRENERRRFKSADYASVEVDFKSFKARLESISSVPVADKKSFDGATGEAKKDVVVLSLPMAEEITGKLSGSKARVVSINHLEKKQSPSIPFTTSTLQQDASRKLKKGVRDIMRIAQSLYEQGFITYMRTDSPTLSQECIRASRKQVESLFGEGYLSPKPRNYSARSAVAQEAHEAIRPAGDTFRLPKDTGLKGDELKLYTLIWKRTVATQMAEARKSTTTVKLESGEYGLTASGTSILFDGFLRVYSVSTEGEEELYDTDEDLVLLPDMKKDDQMDIEKAAASGHRTEPSQRFNEATLVKMLESEGIGRPSTYAQIISTILDRGYAVKVRNSLVPTFTGYFVSSFLLSNFPLYVGYEFTKDMEDGLDKVAVGEESKKDYLDKFWKGDGNFAGLSNDISSISRGVRISESKNLNLENLSGRFMQDGEEYTYQIKMGKFGPYLSYRSLTNPEKEGNASINEKEYFPGEFTDEKARSIIFAPAEVGTPMAADPDYVVENGKFGAFIRRLSDDRTCNAPKKKDLVNLSKDEIELLFSLPKVLGSDEKGEAVLKLGPYGYYASYAGMNYKVTDPLAVTFDDIRRESSPKNEEKSVISSFGVVEGEVLEILDGKYGPYIKWGRKNVPLTSEEKKDPSAVSLETALERAKSYEPKKRSYRKK